MATCDKCASEDVCVGKDELVTSDECVYFIDNNRVAPLETPETPTSQDIHLRDYFAAMALQGMTGNGISHDTMCKAAYRIANLMLEERRKK